MDPTSLTALATQVAGVFDKALGKLPSHDQRVIKEFFKFLDHYENEVNRADADTEDLVTWRRRKETLINTVLKSIKRPS